MGSEVQRDELAIGFALFLFSMGPIQRTFLFERESEFAFVV
jgi:hypothetical protein